MKRRAGAPTSHLSAGELDWLRDWLENTPHGRRFMRDVKESPRDYVFELATGLVAEKDEGLGASDA